jgi:hypothetical protein
MQVRYTFEVMVWVPDGSELGEGRAIILPNGEWVKPWVVMELNDDQDLTHSQLIEAGMDCDDLVISREVMP